MGQKCIADSEKLHWETFKGLKVLDPFSKAIEEPITWPGNAFCYLAGFENHANSPSLLSETLQAFALHTRGSLLARSLGEATPAWGRPPPLPSATAEVGGGRRVDTSQHAPGVRRRLAWRSAGPAARTGKARLGRGEEERLLSLPPCGAKSAPSILSRLGVRGAKIITIIRQGEETNR